MSGDFLSGDILTGYHFARGRKNLMAPRDELVLQDVMDVACVPKNANILAAYLFCEKTG